MPNARQMNASDPHGIYFTKNSIDCMNLRLQAEQEMENGDYSTAINSYNKALISSCDDAKLTSFCYAERATIFLKLGFYKHCIENIELAKASGYPAEDMPKLLDKEQKCLKTMKKFNNNKTSNKLFVKYFKLSHDEPNPKLPFFAQCLKLGEDSTISENNTRFEGWRHHCDN